MSESYVLIATFTLPTEAQIACGRLQAEGISAHVTSDVPSAFSGFSGMGRVELYVSAADAEHAAKILAECMEEQQFTAGTERRPEQETPVWVCSLCGDAVSIEETVCAACGTSREALRPAKSKDLHENRPAKRFSRSDLQTDEPVDAGPTLEPDFELPALDNLQQGDVLANRAFKAALVNLICLPIVFAYTSFCGGIPLALLPLVFLGQLLFYGGELSPSGMRKLLIAIVLDLVQVLGLLILLWALVIRFRV